MRSGKPSQQSRKPGASREWGWDLPTEAFLAPMDPEDLDAAEGLNNDNWGVTLPEKLPKKGERS